MRAGDHYEKTNDTKISASNSPIETAKVVSIENAPSVKAQAKVINFNAARSEMKKAA